jgi:hypothetical protein
MAGTGASFRDELINEIYQWKIPDLHVYKEAWVGSRFVGQKRFLDFVVEYHGRTLGIEAKTQQTEGTAYQKLAYAVEDVKRAPIPALLVFSGAGIGPDVKAQLISSGVGLELEWEPGHGFSQGLDILKQRILMELGLNWLEEQSDKRVF